MLLTHNDANRVLIDIISAVIEQKVTSVQIRNVELPKPDTEEKGQRFDVNCSIENGDQVNVEMHSTPIYETGEENREFKNKCAYFLADLHSSQKSRGVDYSKLVRTYQVTFTSFPVFGSHPDFVSRFSLRDAEGRVFTDQINQIIIELSKLNEIIKKPVERLTSFEKWLLFLRFAPDSMQRNKINDIINEREEIGMASAILQEISRDENERALYHSRKKYEMDTYHNMSVLQRMKDMVADREAELADRDAKLADKDAKLADQKAEIADKDAEIADRDAKLVNQKAVIADKDAKLADQKAVIADKDAEIARLSAELKSVELSI